MEGPEVSKIGYRHITFSTISSVLKLGEQLQGRGQALHLQNNAHPEQVEQPDTMTSPLAGRPDADVVHHEHRHSFPSRQV